MAGQRYSPATARHRAGSEENVIIEAADGPSLARGGPARRVGDVLSTVLPDSCVNPNSCVNSPADSCDHSGPDSCVKLTPDTPETPDPPETQGVISTPNNRALLSPFSKFVEILEAGGQIRWSLADHIQLSVEHHIAHIEADDQTKMDAYVSPLFRFCRCLKAHPKVTGLTGWEALEVTEAELRRVNEEDPWTVLELESCERAGDPCTEAVKEDFVLTWDRVKVPHGSQPLARAIRLAEAHPIPAEAIGPGGKLASYRTTLSLCWWLARIRGGRIFVSCRQIGRVVGASHERGAQLLRLAVGDEWLRIVRRHRPGQRQAHEYEFNAERIPVEIRELADEILGEKKPERPEEE